MEIESLAALEDHLDDDHAPLNGLRLQGLDLTGYADRFARRRDLTGLVVLGGVVPREVADILLARGAIVFPGVADAPVDPWRGLYLPEELYAGLDEGYENTPDALAYRWFVDAHLRADAYCTLVRAIHDDTVTDELDEFVADRMVVGVMGGHAVERAGEPYAAAARLGHTLAEAGYLVTTGGGPGAMEAANLGALCPDADSLDRALARLAAVRGFSDVTAWAGLALEVRRELVGDRIDAPTEILGPSARSLGIPTWFYGHEPPNVFCDAVAKYFSNGLREDGLIARCNAGIVVLDGAAGTVQEIFQAMTPLYYSRAGEPAPPLVLVGVRHWTIEVPVWPAVSALASQADITDSVHLVDRIEDVAALIRAR